MTTLNPKKSPCDAGNTTLNAAELKNLGNIGVYVTPQERPDY
jgi:hypothetical protein